MDYQREAVERLHLPFPLLSDEQLKLTRAMNLPTFEAGGEAVHPGDPERYGRTCVLPRFPPDRSASEVIEWLSQRASAGKVRRKAGSLPG